jgi:hypothetical protein
MFTLLAKGPCQQTLRDFWGLTIGNPHSVMLGDEYRCPHCSLLNAPALDARLAHAKAVDPNNMAGWVPHHLGDGYR